MVDAPHLRAAQCAIDLRQTIVPTEDRVLMPCVGVVPPLVAHRTDLCGQMLVACDDHSAFAGGDLFVRIEGKHGRIAECAYATTIVLRADGFARIFDNSQVMSRRNIEKIIHRRRYSEGVNDDDGARACGDCLFHAHGIEVQGLMVDIYKDRRCTFVEDSVRRGDERERGNDYLIAGAYAEGADA